MDNHRRPIASGLREVTGSTTTRARLASRLGGLLTMSLPGKCLLVLVALAATAGPLVVFPLEARGEGPSPSELARCQARFAQRVNRLQAEKLELNLVVIDELQDCALAFEAGTGSADALARCRARARDRADRQASRLARVRAAVVRSIARYCSGISPASIRAGSGGLDFEDCQLNEADTPAQWLACVESDADPEVGASLTAAKPRSCELLGGSGIVLPGVRCE